MLAAVAEPAQMKVTRWTSFRVVVRSAAIAVVALSFLSACSPLRVLNDLLVPSSGWRADRDIPYGPDSRQRLDVYVPESGPRPAAVVVFFYGGAWRGGHRDDYRFAGEALTSRGYIAVIPDYRVYPDVGFPEFVEDGAHAVAWVRDHIAAYGGDPERVFVMGHSAGAHIAALLVTDRRYLAEAGVDDGAVRGFIGMAGPYAFDPLRYAGTRPIFARLADPAAAQPTAHVVGGEPPMLLLHGGSDDTVYPVNSEALADRVRKAGGSATLVEYAEMGHIRIVLSLAKPFRRGGGVLDEVAEFVEANTMAALQAARPSRADADKLAVP